MVLPYRGGLGGNLVPRAHDRFGQQRSLSQTKRIADSGNEIVSGDCRGLPGGSDELVSSANPSSPAIVTSRQEKRANVETFRK